MIENMRFYYLQKLRLILTRANLGERPAKVSWLKLRMHFCSQPCQAIHKSKNAYFSFATQILDVYTMTQLFYTKFNLQKFENVHYLLSTLSKDS